ncbi:6-carboxytetrahydropterin synthase QueD [Dissulfurirhabdus thermomarina]|uniref:6-carboxy-5,6,7,8-tetrahydropterin synthase n=1 Tax=Dissulfurirhabdus thermomarina TaxID=1765737 RepID=A0A6N9TND3_DISTH|nr:6-carboxytetrahydropterin synthase QueD [Dissulfurirhabdus thermomarina]NDY42765.1 6-carboxytetrahydropterin synthase QueD [Dissulfurirhabdus thermomarina]NMX24106.1 6-carboxytetrahydropterin synthase QueD [Dissulfurirhabdus thermomarina]
MYEIFCRTHFSAAHYLRDYPGDCEHLHGHNWEVEAVVRAEGLNEIGVGIDFRDLKAALGTVLEELDHTNINDHPAFQDRNPSSEHLAAYIHRRLGEEIAAHPGVRVARVTVCETPKTGVTYIEDPSSGGAAG